MGFGMAKNLIAYFSRAGANYLGGSIVNLDEGNTQVVAKKIQALAGGDLFHIDTVVPYPADYHETTEVAKDELGRRARPELKFMPEGAGAYDTVFLGYPIWWGVMPMAVLTFLESCDFSGKTIVPFCTHEGSGFGISERYIRQSCPKSEVLRGLAVWGSKCGQADADIRKWLKALNLLA